MSAKQRYPYAMVGGFMLLVALAAGVWGATQPLVSITFDGDGSEEYTAIVYDAAAFSVEGDGAAMGAKYRDPNLDGGLGIPELRKGTIGLYGGLTMCLLASLLLLAAPLAGLTATRVAATIGVLGAASLAVGLAFFFLGYSDQASAFIDAMDDGMAIDGTNLLGGTYAFGLAAVLATGGSLLGFSDKKPVGTFAEATY